LELESLFVLGVPQFISDTLFVDSTRAKGIAIEEWW
jgi:hypothetical protein